MKRPCHRVIPPPFHSSMAHIPPEVVVGVLLPFYEMQLPLHTTRMVRVQDVTSLWGYFTRDITRSLFMIFRSVQAPRLIDFFLTVVSPRQIVSVAFRAPPRYRYSWDRRTIWFSPLLPQSPYVVFPKQNALRRLVDERQHINLRSNCPRFRIAGGVLSQAFLHKIMHPDSCIVADAQTLGPVRELQLSWNSRRLGVFSYVDDLVSFCAVRAEQPLCPMTARRVSIVSYRDMFSIVMAHKVRDTVVSLTVRVGPKTLAIPESMGSGLRDNLWGPFPRVTTLSLMWESGSPTMPFVLDAHTFPVVASITLSRHNDKNYEDVIGYPTSTMHGVLEDTVRQVTIWRLTSAEILDVAQHLHAKSTLKVCKCYGLRKMRALFRNLSKNKSRFPGASTYNETGAGDLAILYTT